MFTAMGPALDAELSYRRERLAGEATPRRAWWRRRADVPAVPAASRWPFGALVEVRPAAAMPTAEHAGRRTDRAA